MSKYFNDSEENLTQPRILIGAGDVGHQNTYLEYCDKLSCEYNVVSSGEGVLKNYNNFPYDVIILLQSFSDMPVLKVCRQIRETEFDKISPIPIVILQTPELDSNKPKMQSLLTAKQMNKLRVFILPILGGVPDFQTFCRLINQVLPANRAKLLVDENRNDDNKGRELSC